MNSKKIVSGHEIDIVAIALLVLRNWKRLLLFTGIGGVVGVVVALNTPRAYTATVVLAPEVSAGGTGMASSLADMASNFGIDLGKKSSMDAIYPEIYPDVFASSDFTHQLFDVKVRLIDDNRTRTYLDHLMKDVKFPFWAYPSIWLENKMAKPDIVAKGGGKGFVDSYRISTFDAKLCESLGKNITCTVDKKTSEITISFTDQDPMVAAIMVDTLQTRLQDYITEYRTHKARIDYEYYDKMVKEAENKFSKAQTAYTSFADSHMDAVLSSVSSTQSTLEQEMSNAYATYATMMKMRDQAKGKIQEFTPAFTIIQSAKIPHRASSRPRSVTVLLFAFMFGFVYSVRVATKHLWNAKSEDNFQVA